MLHIRAAPPHALLAPAPSRILRANSVRPRPALPRGFMPEFIYTMKDLRKVVPPKREILKGIWLSFYHGAKIGVLGLNGAGKSSLLRIMAGVDRDHLGEAFL